MGAFAKKFILFRALALIFLSCQLTSGCRHFSFLFGDGIILVLRDAKRGLISPARPKHLSAIVFYEKRNVSCHQKYLGVVLREP